MCWLRLFVIVLAVFRGFMALALDFIPDQSVVLAGYDNRDSVEARLRSLPLHDIEGIWQWPDNGSLVVIERCRQSEVPDDGAMRFRMIVMRSPRLSVRPGTVMGYVSMTAVKNVFSASIYTDFDGGTVLSRVKDFVLSLKDSRLSFSRRKSGLRINLWRMVPYMFRYSVSRREEKGPAIEGCIKIFPPSVSNPVNVRYL